MELDLIGGRVFHFQVMNLVKIYYFLEQTYYVFGAKYIIFWSSYAHIINTKKDILVLGREPTQGLEHKITTEKMYSINFTVTKKKCGCITTEQIVIYLLKVQKFTNLKQKILRF